MVVEDGRAAGERELREPGARGGVLRLRVDPRPDGIELAEPREEVCLLRPGPREGLVEVVVRVDEARRDDGAAEVDALLVLRLLAGADGRDRRVLDEHPAVGVLGAGVVHRDDPAVRVQRRASRVTLSRCSIVVARERNGCRRARPRRRARRRSARSDGRLTRRFATPALARAGELVAGVDGGRGADGPARRRRQRDRASRAPVPPLVLGSHIDTVPDAGRLRRTAGRARGARRRRATGGARRPRSLEVVAFADEEGTRFGTTYLGSAAYTGSFDGESLDLVDGEGITLRDAIRDAGGDPDTAVAAAAPELAGYVEVHIEQGPVLEREGLPVGVVTAIAGQTRARITLTGEAGHAGTLPMDGRRDALAAASEVVLAVERLARATARPGRDRRCVVAGPGRGERRPGRDADVAGRAARRRPRSPAGGGRDPRRGRADRGRRGVDAGWTLRYDTPAVELDPGLRGRLADAVRDKALPVRELVSGAGHDAVVLSRICPAAMLFVRCAGGISHDPRESVSEEDVAVALDVLERVVRSFA